MLQVAPPTRKEGRERQRPAWRRSPSRLQLGQTIEANIMDSGDVDWYHLSGTKEKSVTVRLENGAEAFWPKIQVRDADKSVVQGWLWPNARGANLQFSFPSEPGKDYYVIVAAYESGSSGKYRLSTR